MQKDDLISKAAAIDAVKKNTFRLTFAEEQNCEGHVAWSAEAVYSDVMEGALLDLPSAQPEQRNAIVFQGIVVEYPSISAYPEYEGKPYFSIKYTVNGQKFIGYGTYKPEVLSEYLKEYFMPPAQPGWIPCTTETMPKNKSNVLTVIYIPGRQAHIRSGWYEDGLFMNDNGDTWKATDKEVVGWMYQPKLPKPYREGGQDDG